MVLCFQCTDGSHIEVLTANAFLRYNPGEIDLYRIPHLPSSTQSQGWDDNLPPTPLVIWSYRGDRVSRGHCGLYYNRTDSVLPNFYLLDDRDSHLIEFGMDTPADAGRDPCVRYPTVLNHTITPANNDHIRNTKSRKGTSCSLDSAREELHLTTTLLDDLSRCGHFRAALGQCGGFQGLYGLWIGVQEFDEVTGRILILLLDAFENNRRLVLADLPQRKNSHS